MPKNYLQPGEIQFTDKEAKEIYKTVANKLISKETNTSYMNLTLLF
jgi:hypothetical protein